MLGASKHHPETEGNRSHHTPGHNGRVTQPS